MLYMLIVSRLPILIDCTYDNNLFSAQGTLTQHVKDQPMLNQVQKNSDLDENALNLLPQTSSQASNGGRASGNADANSQR